MTRPSSSSDSQASQYPDVRRSCDRYSTKPTSLDEALARPLVSLETLADALSHGNVRMPLVMLQDFLQSSADRLKRSTTAIKASRAALEHLAMTVAFGADAENVKVRKLQVDTLLKVAQMRKADEPEGERVLQVPFIAVYQHAPTALGLVIDQLPDDEAVMPDNMTPRMLEQATNETVLNTEGFEPEPLVQPDPLVPTHIGGVTGHHYDKPNAQAAGSLGAPEPKVPPQASALASVQNQRPVDGEDAYGRSLVERDEIDHRPHIPEPNPDNPVGLPDLSPVSMHPSDHAKNPVEHRTVQWDSDPVPDDEKMTRHKAAEKLGFRR